MTAVISRTSFDRLDSYALWGFRSAVLGFIKDPDNPNERGDFPGGILPRDGRTRLIRWPGG